ncbi:hypothetical protein ACFE04_026663 [Oxalis oulophora]
MDLSPNQQQQQAKSRLDGVDCSSIITIGARKTLKADREKLRRDRLNEQFIDLGTTLDPDRPKNDKATILADTIQLLKELTSQVDKLKAEHSTLTEEARELTQEKNDLREEKASLKTEIEELNIQYQQRGRAAMFPWGAMDHSVVMTPPSYPYPMPMAMPPGTIPPYPVFGNQNQPCPTFVPYMAPNATLVQQLSTQHVHPGNQSHVSGKRECKSKSSLGDKSEDSNHVTTDLELKTPGSTGEQEDFSSGQRKHKKSIRRKNLATDGTCSSSWSSSRSVQDSSSESVVGGRKAVDIQPDRS